MMGEKKEARVVVWGWREAGLLLGEQVQVKEEKGGWALVTRATDTKVRFHSDFLLF